MSGSPAVRFVRGGAVLAVALGLVGLPLIWGRFAGSGAWATSGWLSATAVGLGAGAWMARVHGRPGPGFLAALVTGMLARLVVVGVGLVLALRAGDGPGWGFLCGFAIGFVPLQAYEVVWSMRAAKARSAAADPVSREARDA
jgi:ABC-type spermidine/putrescine transport system permease subunit II